MQILALHGFTGRGSDFAPFAELVGGDWHYPDLPGHGPDPDLDCTPEATVDFVERERTNYFQRNKAKPDPSSDLCPLTSVLLGYSLGARAALQHAIVHPEAWDALILISPNPGIENPAERADRRATDAKLADRIERDGAAPFIEFWQQTPMIRSQQSIRHDWRAQMQIARESHTAEGLATSLRQFGQGSCPNLWPELNTLTMPLCLVTGEQDRKYADIAQKMHNTLSRRHEMKADQFSIVPAVGHMPHLEAPEATARIVRQFIESI